MVAEVFGGDREAKRNGWAGTNDTTGVAGVQAPLPAVELCGRGAVFRADHASRDNCSYDADVDDAAALLARFLGGPYAPALAAFAFGEWVHLWRGRGAVIPRT